MASLFVFGPDDFSVGQPLDEPGAIEKMVGVLFNPRKGCCTFSSHGAEQYLIPEGIATRSTGFKCTGCSSTVRRFTFKSVYTCRCSISVLGDKTTPFTEEEWHHHRVDMQGPVNCHPRVYGGR
jgi:hypothetical protein